MIPAWWWRVPLPGWVRRLLDRVLLWWMLLADPTPELDEGKRAVDRRRLQSVTPHRDRVVRCVSWWMLLVSLGAAAVWALAHAADLGVLHG